MSEKEQQLRAIADEIERCPLCKQGGTGKPVPGEGTGEARVMFIGEAPGRIEAQTGRPFIGRSGQFLRKIIADVGLDAEHVFLTSPVHYLPLRGTPSQAMIEHGCTHLHKQLEIINPRVVVLLGNTACRALLGRPVQIAKDHGTIVDKDGIMFFITCHPAYAVRFPEGKKNFLEDLTLLRNLLTKRC